jgi:ketosteroid isomerase-like protein
MNSRKRILAAVLLAALAAVPLLATMTKTDEAAIRALDEAWSHAAGTKDLDKTVSFYADDASMLPSNAPIATGSVAIRTAWSQLMAAPGYGLHFAPSKIVISKSGDLAYEIGTFELTMNDAQGKPVTTVGKYVVNWQKHGREWKVAADIFNDDK